MMSGARRAAGGESRPPGRCKHSALRAARWAERAGETPPSARPEPSTAAGSRPGLQRRRERPRGRWPQEGPGSSFPGGAVARGAETPSKLCRGFGRRVAAAAGTVRSQTLRLEPVPSAGSAWSPSWEAGKEHPEGLARRRMGWGAARRAKRGEGDTAGGQRGRGSNSATTHPAPGHPF